MVNRPVVITLHGIRTRGEWQKRIAPLIARYGMIPVLLDYGYFNLLQFLNPWSRDKRVRWLRDEVARVRSDFPDSPVSVVAHSLGTYLVARLIEEEPNFNFATLIFSGCIVDAEHKWAAHLDNNRIGHLANYVAHQDIWPKLARQVIRGPRAGVAGVTGFSDKHYSLYQHAHPSYGHSDYFSPNTFEAMWLPKLVLPQRQFINMLRGLLAECTRLLGAAMPDCHARTRLFIRLRGSRDFQQADGMHVASGEAARYSDDELGYKLTDGSASGPYLQAPPAFQAALTKVATQWCAAGGHQPSQGRADVVAAVAAPLLAAALPQAMAVGMVVVEVLARRPDNVSQLAPVVSPLVPQLLQEVAQAGGLLQALFPKEWV